MPPVNAPQNPRARGRAHTLCCRDQGSSSSLEALVTLVPRHSSTLSNSTPVRSKGMLCVSPWAGTGKRLTVVEGLGLSDAPTQQHAKHQDQAEGPEVQHVVGACHVKERGVLFASEKAKSETAIGVRRVGGCTMAVGINFAFGQKPGSANVHAQASLPCCTGSRSSQRRSAPPQH